MAEKKARPQNKNLRPNPDNLGVKPLEKGEESALVRIRADERALRAFKNLSAEERGGVIMQWYTHTA